LSLGSGVSGTSPQRLTRHTSACFRSRAPGPVSGQLYGKHRLEDRSRAPLSCCLSAAGIGFLGVLFPPGNPAFLTVGLPAAPRRRRRTLTGFPRSARMRCGRAGCPLYPGGDGVPCDHRDVRGRRLPPCNGWPLPPQYRSPDPGCQIDEASTRIQGHSPFRPSPHLWHPAGTGALGLSPELRTRPLPATHVRAGTGLEH
jgi:hypothetical protein